MSHRLSPLAGRLLLRTIVAAWCLLHCLLARAEVVVLANRSRETVRANLLPKGEPPRELALEAGDSRPVFFENRLRIRFGEGDSQQEYLLDNRSAYYFWQQPPEGQLVLEKIGLGRTFSDSGRKSVGGPIDNRLASIIPVKIMVDEDELTHRRVWEPRLRKRVARASRVLQDHSGIQLEVVAIETWDSDNSQMDFSQSLAEMEREVQPKPGRVAIGFSSQYQFARGRIHLGGTRGALHSHILLKERSPKVLESERLELLVHELGHFLGAAHSPEPQSVMRPLLGGGLQRSVNAKVRFDPVNTLLVAIMGEELRSGRVRTLADVSIPTKKRMQELYAVLEKSLPKDPAAGQFIRQMGAATTKPLVEDTRKVLLQIVRVARLRRRLGARREIDEVDTNAQEASDQKDTSGPVEEGPLPDAGNGLHETDLLTQYYVRQAALAARQVKREHAGQAMLMAIGIAMDDTQTLRRLPWTEKIVQHIETDGQRRERLAVLGNPTMHGRRDLTKHFFISALLVVVQGGGAARGTGILKELLDTQGGSGLSYADLAANRAGIFFASLVLTGRLSIEEVARGFTVPRFMPSVEGLAEQVTMGDLLRGLGNGPGVSFRNEMDRIDRRVLSLPIYRRPVVTQPKTAR